MKRPSLWVGALLGGLTSLPLMALFYFGRQAAGLPFVPFDLVDWMARFLPGGVVNLGIDTMVRLIGLLRLGPTDSTAKAVEQAQGLVLMFVASILFGVLLAWLLPRQRRTGARLGALLAGVPFAVVAVVESMLGQRGLGVYLWIALVLAVWGAVLGRFLDRQQQPAPAGTPVDRRRALITMAAGSAGAALGIWGLARLFREAAVSSGAGEPLSQVVPTLPEPTPPPTPAGRIDPVPGTRPEVTATEDFYRIDINTVVPFLKGASWSLEVGGLFDRPRTLTLADLLAYPAVTQPVTMQCISNPVGGDLTSTAYWTGVRLRDVAADLGLKSEARALWLKAADGFTESVVLRDIMDDRTLLVYAMNGETLPAEHGFPLRIYIPNRYGMKQPKWIVSMEAIAEPRPGYWVKRGWSQEARPQIVSVIDTIDQVGAAGDTVPVGGIAWAGDRGIGQVEVQVDDGQWAAATLRDPPLSGLTWVQWRYDWPAGPGRHTLRVRATDGTGALQIADLQDTFPDGATGYHEREVTIK